MKEQVGPSEDSAVPVTVAVVADRGTAEPLAAPLEVLRAAGNRATGRWLSQRRRLQRVGGWTGPTVTSPNRAEPATGK